MREYLVLVLVAGALVAACGKNEMVVEVRGGDGHKVRLDANEVQYKYNHLVDPGSYRLPTPDSKLKLESGAYEVNISAGAYLETQVIQVESAPISGVETYRVEFTIPEGSNEPCARQGTIVFASTRTNVRNWDLFTIKADGSELVQLTFDQESEQHPSWSPDGTKILYTHGDVMSNIDIYVMDVASAKSTRLTEHPERDQRASWSPDGRTIAFVSQRDGDVAIWLMDADGGNQRKLVEGREPSWSPDSRRLAFTSSAFDDNDELYLIDLDGANRTRLTENKKFDWFPAFAPGGERIAFNSERFGGQELMLMRVDGSGQTRISIAEKTYEQEPVWSPDGRGLAYAGKMDEKDYDIYLIGAAGFDLDEVQSPQVLPVNLTNNDDRDDLSPSWRSY